MKFKEQTVIQIEIEPGDTTWELYNYLGDLTGDDLIRVVNGAIEISTPVADD